jgi:hypothetical protein
MGAVHRKVFTSLCHIFWDHDVKIDSLRERYRLRSSQLDLKEFGVRSELLNLDLSEAIQHFNQMNGGDDQLQSPQANSVTMTPLDKLECLKNTIQHISVALDKETRAKEEENAKLGIANLNTEALAMTADDLIPILTCIVVNSYATKLHSNLEYMRQFRLSGVLRSGLEYVLSRWQRRA